VKLILVILLSITVLAASAQTWQQAMSVPSFNIDAIKGKWQLKPFASVSAGYMFYNGGISYLSAPVGVALFHPLNTNWTAYGAATLTPTFFSFNNLYALPAGNGKSFGYPFPGGYGTSLTPAIQGGLIYTNDARTFSISGHVRFEKSSYPAYPMAPVFR
jgi:hypothetical protein